MKHTFPFVVHVSGRARPQAAFSEGYDAHAYARWASQTFGQTTWEVTHDSGIVGQYIGGWPTVEFQGRGDEHYPSGLRK